MAREFAITLYLAIFQLFFRFFSLFALQKKTTFVVSFGGNAKATLQALESQVDGETIIILKAPGCRVDFQGDDRTVLDFQPKSTLSFLKGIYHLATSEHLIIDNYYGFLAATPFREHVTCTQLWHAAGAIKQFGLEDLTNTHRSKRALQRFQTVYDRFDHVVVGSDSMIPIFKNSFGLPDERFLKTGIPRTDFFYDKQQVDESMERIIGHFPVIKDKKMLLYAPTYRDGELDSTALQLDLEKMHDQFKYEYVLFLRLHPAVEDSFHNKYPGFVFNVSNYPDINDLLVGADVLITDYSSIPFEFALLEKPMIFYVYDIEAYKKERGVWENYGNRVPGPVVTSTETLMRTLVEKDFQTEKIKPFKEEWNEFSTGQASDNLIRALYDIDRVPEKTKVREHA